MALFSTFQRRLRIVVGCVALLVASPCVTAMPLSRTHAPEPAWAADTDPSGRVYVELLNMQDKAIDKAAVAVEAAHAQNTHLAFVLSILVVVMGAVCAWLVVANLVGHRTASREV